MAGEKGLNRGRERGLCYVTSGTAEIKIFVAEESFKEGARAIHLGRGENIFLERR